MPIEHDLDLRDSRWLLATLVVMLTTMKLEQVYSRLTAPFMNSQIASKPQLPYLFQCHLEHSDRVTAAAS